MEYLTLEQCKKHLVVEHNEDDALIELYAGSAENSVANYLECSLSELEVDGVLPDAITSAMLMLLASHYNYREGFKLSASIIALLKPYKRYGY